MATRRKFPKEVYVRWEPDESEAYLVVEPDAESAEQGERMALYELKEVKVVKRTTTLEKAEN